MFDRFDFFAQRGERAAAEYAKHIVVAPLSLDPVRPELAPHDAALAFEFFQPDLEPFVFDAVPLAHLAAQERSVRLRVAAQQVAEGIVDRLGEGLRQTGWQRNAERVAKLLAEAMRDEAFAETRRQRAPGQAPDDTSRSGGTVASRDERALGGVAAAGTP